MHVVDVRHVRRLMKSTYARYIALYNEPAFIKAVNKENSDLLKHGLVQVKILAN